MEESFRGSVDTHKKLNCLEKYLQAYSIALKNEGFARIYIDAFAGSGHRVETTPALPLLGDAEPQEIGTPGSARIALAVEPPFDTLAFFEADNDRFLELEKLKAEYPNLNIVPRQGDANDFVQRVCKGVNWHSREWGLRGYRGVVFLDPYGMEVDWQTVEAIAETEALDCWYFFPLSGLYRNAPRNMKKLDLGKQAVLDRVLGATDWREKWYNQTPVPRDLFDDTRSATRRADIDAIEQYVGDRLRTVFKGTVLPPMRLRHNGGAPMASLFFAVSNPRKKAVQLATRIAGHILNAGISSQN